jgi:hypothetical protein
MKKPIIIARERVVERVEAGTMGYSSQDSAVGAAAAGVGAG